MRPALSNGTLAAREKSRRFERAAFNAIRVLLELLLWPEPEAARLPWGRDEHRSMTLRLPLLTDLGGDGQPLLRVEGVFVLA
jgi:hypothetical protein